ncbi:cAMP-binding domain of CRP or a regulatory subunit of cAMP-dependent protein kinases [Pedobacter westerhofensis]|uniref:cAMP-binding domain of CRP or a regulatory subunit of cAMP-dependent protein kinases n=1 Tax=Pedobacter westerhofensis TaxID=425512 RepID=A0A521EUY2_9SPHI|nr:response regulator [Pedobacter westerhofensis]SMO87732.1 cAMP-binding domain of CRP or a regulatory subunit of cAMP-dependent protein kinases [Pedobacter westerhofensis]
MSKIKILVIEDNDDIRESIVEILELAGYEVTEAGNGKEGVEMANANLPDLILCDIMMPELDGYGVLYLLNKNPLTSATPFIFLTAKAERMDMRKGMEMGADDYLVKPFDDVELLNAIESRLSKKEKQEVFYSKSMTQLTHLAAGNAGVKELDKMITERKVRSIRKKQIIYYEGDQVSGIYLVLTGKVKTIKLSEDGRELLTGMYGPDEYFGIPALLLNEPYAETAEALEDTTICQLPKDMLEELLNRYPDVARQFIHILSNNLLDKEEQLLQLAYHSVRKRMAEVLIRLCKLEKQEGQISLRISRDNLAAMAGMATETVSRILSDFKDEGIIERKGSQIGILDYLKLQQMKN